MLLFYATTNTQIINMVNTKCSFYPEERAAIVVISGPQISETLVEEVIKAEVFEKVYTMSSPLIDVSKLPMRKLIGVRSLVYHRIRINYFESYFKRIQDEWSVKIDKLFVPHFSEISYHLYIAEILYRKNKKLEIYFVEEGTGNYYDKEIFSVRFRKDAFGKLRWFMCDGHYKLHLKNHVVGFFLYMPEACKNYYQIPRYRLPRICYNDTVFRIMHASAEQLDIIHLGRFARSEIIYFSNYVLEAGKLNSLNAKNEAIINHILEVFSSTSAYIKVHNSSSAHLKSFAEKMENIAYIDRNVYLFESLYALSDIDINNKLLVSAASSAMMYPKYMFNQEPYLIFTYRLYADYIQFGSERDDEYVADLKAVYSDPSKIMVPNSDMELRMMLKDTRAKIQQKKIRGYGGIERKMLREETDDTVETCVPRIP